MVVIEGSTLDADARAALLEGEGLLVDAGLDLLDADDNFIDDISADLITAGSFIEHRIYRTVHGTCMLRVARELQWGTQRVRPFVLLSNDGETWYRWNEGVFLLPTPQRSVGVTPITYDIEGYDKLQVLDTPHGSTYTVASSATIIPAVEALIVAAGESKIQIDQAAATITAPSDQVYSIVDSWKTLGIINDLLDSIGYRALWVDPDGYYRSEPYRAPSELPTTQRYTADDARATTVGGVRTATADYFGAANVVVGINDDLSVVAPTEGAGIKTATNQSDGPTSIDGRGGQIIRREIRGAFASQAALVTATERALEEEKLVYTYLDIEVSPNPTHGHFDVVRYTDAEIPVDGRFLVTEWTLPLDGNSRMSLKLRST